TTRLVWEHSAALSEFSASEISGCLRTLTKSGDVEAHPLHHGRFYFTFTPQHKLRTTDTRWRGGAFGENQKIKLFAKLLVGTIYIPGSIPCTAQQLAKLLGDQDHGLSTQFLIHTEQKKAFYLQVDTSLHARPSRTAQRLREVVFRLAKLPTVKHMVKQRQFELVLIAVTAQRAESILNHFRRYDRVGCTPIRVLVLPELMALLSSIPIGGNFRKLLE
ncbi:MAG TPA: hypothetical protein PKA06_14460, partial [Gemmatales bacterium]|nr:hypothetical protein [Gemmatales bacterium]